MFIALIAASSMDLDLKFMKRPTERSSEEQHKFDLACEAPGAEM